MIVQEEGMHAQLRIAYVLAPPIKATRFRYLCRSKLFSLLLHSPSTQLRWTFEPRDNLTGQGLPSYITFILSLQHCSTSPISTAGRKLWTVCDLTRRGLFLDLERPRKLQIAIREHMKHYQTNAQSIAGLFVLNIPSASSRTQKNRRLRLPRWTSRHGDCLNHTPV